MSKTQKLKTLQQSFEKAQAALEQAYKEQRKKIQVK
jgi:hypothetical protein